MDLPFWHQAAQENSLLLSCSACLIAEASEVYTTGDWNDVLIQSHNLPKVVCCDLGRRGDDVAHPNGSRCIRYDIS
jgi:hypothetical protein